MLATTNTYLLSKLGNDGNTGLASAYPIPLANDAKLTLTAAMAAASAGDEIIIYPGEYANEAIAPNKELTFIGTNREKCIISDNAASGMRLLATCVVKNLTCISTYSAGYGITFGSDYCRLENVTGIGVMGGIDVCGGTYSQIKDCYGKADGYGIGIGTSGPVYFENCVGETTGDRVASLAAAGFGASSVCSNAVLVNCRSIANRSLTDNGRHVAGYAIDGQAILVNCTARVRHTAVTGDHEAYGILCEDPSSKCCVIGGNLDVDSTINSAVGVMTDNGGICVVSEGTLIKVTADTPIPTDCTAQSVGNKKTQFIDTNFGIAIKANDYWNGWDVLWLTGNNAGEHEEVLDWDTEADEFFFAVGFTHDIEVGDTYQLQRYWSYPLKNIDGDICISNSFYDTIRTSGVITQGGSGWAAAVNAEVQEILKTNSIYR